ncbi:MAG: hypothetical protein VKL39_24325 [Leptolyngbyaceae bacterium]|nr:hypothetical protein [Leptolyngbyaceae bacterium]
MKHNYYLPVLRLASVLGAYLVVRSAIAGHPLRSVLAGIATGVLVNAAIHRDHQEAQQERDRAVGVRPVSEPLPPEAPPALSKPATPTTLPQYRSPVDALISRPTSALIAGVPGAGKGLVTALAVRGLVRRIPKLSVLIVDPKGSYKEQGYWAGYRTRATDLGGLAAKDPQAAIDFVLDAIADFEALPFPRLLVWDEMLLTSQVVKLLDTRQNRLLQRWSLFLAGIITQGDSEQSWVWLLSQSALISDLPFGSGVRSTLRAIGLAAPHNRQAVESLVLARGFLSPPPGGLGELYGLMGASPVKRAWFDGGTRVWAPTPRLDNLSGFDRDKQNGGRG